METERLIIRRFNTDDWQDLYEYLSDENVVRYEPYDILSMDKCRQEAINRAGNEAFWAVCLKDSGKLIGNLYFSKQDFDTWELGYVFNAKFHNNGYATEAAKFLVDIAFKEWGAYRITAMCNPLNTSSWRLLERLNMRREGHLIKNIYFKKDENGNPLWSDTYEYGILSTEW